MLTSHLRTAGAQTDNVGKRSVTFYHRGDPGNAHGVTLNWLAARVCKAPFGSTVGGPKLFRPESDWFVWMFVLNCVSRMKQAGGHVWFLELIFSLSGSEGDSHLAAPSLHLTISNIYCDCGSRMTAKDNYTDYICTQCVASTRRHTHTHLHADAAADWKEEISVFLGFIPGVYRGLWCTGGGALEMSRHRSQLRGPLWVHSEGSKQERGPPVRLHSGRQIGMILEVMKLWSREREDAFGSDELGRQVKPWHTSAILVYGSVEGCWNESRSRISTEGRGYVTKPKDVVSRLAAIWRPQQQNRVWKRPNTEQKLVNVHLF